MELPLNGRIVLNLYYTVRNKNSGWKSWTRKPFVTVFGYAFWGELGEGESGFYKLFLSKFPCFHNPKIIAREFEHYLHGGYFDVFLLHVHTVILRELIHFYALKTVGEVR